jgi:Flp pilus assembly protein protease CpaA
MVQQPIQVSLQTIISIISLIPLGVASWQDIRTRHVSNWITLPLFFLAWPLAWWFNGWNGLFVTAIVFVVTLLAMPVGFGAADGKLAVFLAAMGGLPAVLLALIISLLLLLVSRLFPDLAKRLAIIHQEEDGLHIAGVISFFMAAVVFLLAEMLI